ncbi:hypothetical protein Ga0080559_TMP3231 [Salipiger profundus]|uniref:Uncharacterized protein n=1 Tax=Salipiger profundus TaxID=1229727 RepID=A0A1U7D781_9RHOB|nr:hypothetical protein Ga0080559_TMP3231 [Salipiger profundus]
MKRIRTLVHLCLRIGSCVPLREDVGDVRECAGRTRESVLAVSVGSSRGQGHGVNLIKSPLDRTIRR